MNREKLGDPAATLHSLAARASELKAQLAAFDRRNPVIDVAEENARTRALWHRLHAMGLPPDQVFMVLVLADEYGAYLIEKHARPPMRQRRREWGEREREGMS